MGSHIVPWRRNHQPTRLIVVSLRAGCADWGQIVRASAKRPFCSPWLMLSSTYLHSPDLSWITFFSFWTRDLTTQWFLAFFLLLHKYKKKAFLYFWLHVAIIKSYVLRFWFSSFFFFLIRNDLLANKIVAKSWGSRFLLLGKFCWVES